MAQAAGTKENPMGYAPMKKLILTTSTPLMLSLLINSLYNFVDSVFVSRMSEEALTALSLASPIQTLVSALGLGNAVGLNAVISKALGERRPEKVRKAANAAIFIALCAWAIIVIMCLLLTRPYFKWQSGGNETIAKYGRDYMTVYMLFSFGQMGQWVFERFVISSGKSSLFLSTLSAASITNLILDPIFIFGWFGLPRMETLGAALAIELEDNAVCMFNMENGLPGIMNFSWTNYGGEDNGSTIYGTKGVMKIFGDYVDDIVLEMRDGVQVKYSVGAIQTNQNQTKSGVIDEFVASIIEGREPIVTGIDGHNTLAVIETAMKSSQERRWMDIEY